MSDFVTRYLKRAKEQPMPPSIRLGRALGPGVILLATAMGSGEIFFWPGIAASYGFQFLWLTIAAIVFQYVLNTEFLRYTISTGEAVVIGYVRLWSGFKWIFLASAILPWIWPGWAMGGATALTWVFGGDAVIIGASSLIIIGLLLTTSRFAYRSLELTEKLLIAFVLIIAAVTAGLVVRGPSLEAAAAGMTQSPLPLPEGLSLPVLLAALAFCGAGGTINLATSNWARDKGMGLAVHAPKVVNPFSGENVAVSADVYVFSGDDDNKARWISWWRLVRMEQQITFLGAGAFGLIAFMLIAHALIGDQGLGVGMQAVKAQAETLGDRYGAALRIAFSIGVAAIFLTSAVGVMDHAARLSASLLSSRIAASGDEKAGLSESVLYFFSLWLLIGFGLFVLLGLDVSSPPALLTIAGALSGIVMFVYSVLTLILNAKMRSAFEAYDARFSKNNPFAVSILRTSMLYGAVMLYGALSIAVVYNAWKAVAS